MVLNKTKFAPKYKLQSLIAQLLKLHNLGHHTNALSFYRSKIILDPPNCFGLVQIILVGCKSFRSCPNQNDQVQVQIRLLWTNFFLDGRLDFSGLVFILWICPKQIGPQQKVLDSPRLFWTYRRTRH